MYYSFNSFLSLVLIALASMYAILRLENGRGFTSFFLFCGYLKVLFPKQFCHDLLIFSVILWLFVVRQGIGKIFGRPHL